MPTLEAIELSNASMVCTILVESGDLEKLNTDGVETDTGYLENHKGEIEGGDGSDYWIN